MVLVGAPEQRGAPQHPGVGGTEHSALGDEMKAEGGREGGEKGGLSHRNLVGKAKPLVVVHCLPV